MLKLEPLLGMRAWGVMVVNETGVGLFVALVSHVFSASVSSSDCIASLSCSACALLQIYSYQKAGKLSLDKANGNC